MRVIGDLLFIGSLTLASCVSMRTAFAADAVPTPSVALITLDGVIDQDADDTPAFTPGGDVVFFDRTDGPRKTVMESRLVQGKWSPPRPASFSGRWFDQDPVMAPDGRYLLFNSDRPVLPGSNPLVQHYFGRGAAPGSNIWRVDRKGDGWGEPVWLGLPIDDDVFIDFASIAADGTIYYMRVNAPSNGTHIWRSRLQAGHYLAPEFVPLGDPDEPTHDPAIAPDQSFIVFDYGRVAGGLGRLSIAFKEGDRWGPRIDLGDAINSSRPWGAHVAADGRTLHFTDQTGIHQMSLEPLLRAHSKGCKGVQ